MRPRGIAALCLLLAAGCSTSEALCDCALGGTTVLLPDGLTETAIRVSGDACDDSDVTCGGGAERQNGLCTDGGYFIASDREGTCHIEIDLDGHGTFVRDVRFKDSDGCCGGVYPVDGDWTVHVVAP